MISLIQHLNITCGVKAFHFLTSLLRILLVAYVWVARGLPGATTRHLRVGLPTRLIDVPNIILCVPTSRWHPTDIKQNSVSNRESMRAGTLVRLWGRVVLWLLSVGYEAAERRLLPSEVISRMRILLLHESIGVSALLLRVRGVVFYVRRLLYLLLALRVHLLLHHLLLLLARLPLSLERHLITDVVIVVVLAVGLDSMVSSLLRRDVRWFGTACCLLFFAVERIPLHYKYFNWCWLWDYI